MKELDVPLEIFQTGKGLRCNLRRGEIGLELSVEVKLQLPPITPVAFTEDQGIFEEKGQGRAKLEEESAA